MKKTNVKGVGLAGVITEIVTPWKADGTLDLLSLERMVEFQHQSGIAESIFMVSVLKQPL